MNLSQAAHEYARRGWMVFPLRPGMKTPATGKGFKDASREPAQIDKWWNFRAAYADRNIGVTTSPESGIWVLDCDTDKETGEIGEDTLTELIKEYGPLPDCPMQVTPSGGRHYVFAWPDDGKDLPRKIRFRPGLDSLGSRTDGGKAVSGYFIVAPSSRPDGEYGWEVSPFDVAPPQAPRWLVDMIRASVKARPADMPTIEPVLNGATTRYGRKALEELCDEIANCPPGSQDDNLIAKATRIGSIQAGGHIEYQEAFTSAVSAGMRMQASDGPWLQKVVEDKVRRGMAYGARDPYLPQPKPPSQNVNRPRLQLVTSDQRAPEPEIYDSVNVDTSWKRGLEWVENDKGEPKSTSLHNIRQVIQYHPHLVGLYRYDRFSDSFVITRPLIAGFPGAYPRPITDHDETALAAWLNINGVAPAITTVASLIREVAMRDSFDPLTEYMEGLKWDGENRIDDWLTVYAGATDNSYTRIVGRKFLIGAVARAMDPGCKVDAMIIWEGAQNLGKSTAARVLCGDDMFTDQVGDVTSKDSAERIQGAWFVEIPEMDKFSRHEANAVKDFLSRREDNYRPAYGRNAIKRKRRCVFFGTINPDGIGYLKDSTGNRRFWPVAVTKVELEALKRDRDQIWAEALDAYRAGEEWWIAPQDAHLVEPEQESRRDDDVWEAPVREWLRNLDPTRRGFTSSDALRGMGIEIGKQTHREKIRISKILHMLGCESRNNVNGIRGRSWERPSAQA